MKFGGSSVRDAAMIRSVLAIVRERLPQAPLLVASAMGKTTDALVGAAERAVSGDRDAAFEALGLLEDSHRDAAVSLTLGDARTSLVAAIDELFSEMKSLLQGIYLIRECSPRSRDALLSFGERLSKAIIAAAAREEGIGCELIDARALIVTDSSFGAAAPLPELTRSRTRERARPRQGVLLVTQGFIASTEEGVTATLGRGGSDYTATILGAALDAEAVEIWTDVDGIMTADPRVIPAARSIPFISYDEAAELAYFGAKVVHPATILPAMERGIPVWVKNTGRPDHAGTRIQAVREGTGIRAIASKTGVTLLTVQSSRMLNAYGFLRALFSVFDQNRVSVDLVATSEVSVSVTVDRDVDTRVLERELASLGTVAVERQKSIICLVGRGLFDQAGFLASVFGSIDPIPVRMISLGSSDINLSIVVAQEETETVVRRLHDRLFSAG